MHDDSTPTDHDLKFHSQTPGGLAKMTHWWVCSCGWKSDRGIGHDGFRHAEAAAAGHAAQYGVPLADDEMTPDDYARVGRAMARVLFAAWRATSKTAAPEPPVPQPKPKRTRSLKPSSIAAFEAQWQAEHAGDEAES